MDAIDLLGSILGRKMKSSGRGGKILKDLLGGGRSKQPEPQYQEQGQSRDDFSRGSGYPQGSRRDRGHHGANSLEDMLGVAVEHNRKSRDKYQPRAESQSRPQQRQPRFAPEQEELNEQSKILIKAMLNATKSDGKLDQDEQKNIYQQLDHVSQEEIEFLRAEFEKNVSVRDFTWDVPIGMEEQVYAISLCAIDLDENREAKYLAELAHGLRLEPQQCNQIHRRYGAPEIFKS